MSERPRLAGGQLIVDGRPTLVLGGELHNSSGSTALCMASRWAGIRDAGCTTVLAPIAWEQLEPEEGRFDFCAVDHLLDGARAHGLRLVLLWFGSWKNAGSTYVPTWVKRNPDRFEVQHLAGAPTTVLSPFCEANAEADARAFARLLAHLHSVDGDHTVVMVQVENEVGSMGDSRDRSPAAEAAWAKPVPEALLTHLHDDPEGCAAQLTVTLDPAAGAAPTWAEAFGESEATDELFMAWHLARYVERVASAGRSQHELPMYVNAWLNAEVDGAERTVAGGMRPGEYPSGGPLPHVAAAWHAAAPSIDFLAPDIYARDVDTWLRRYRAAGATLFVPELRRSRLGVHTIFLAIAEYGAIGTAPFGVDELQPDEREALTQAYRQLAAIEMDVLDAQRAGAIRGFSVELGANATPELRGYRFTISPDLTYEPDPPPAPGYGLLLALGPHEFLAAGSGFVITARTTDGGPTALLTAHELTLDAPTGRAQDLPVLRWLNGDETLGGFGIRVTGDVVSTFGGIPASGSITGLVRFSLYPAPAPERDP